MIPLDNAPWSDSDAHNTSRSLLSFHRERITHLLCDTLRRDKKTKEPLNVISQKQITEKWKERSEKNGKSALVSLFFFNGNWGVKQKSRQSKVFLSGMLVSSWVQILIIRIKISLSKFRIYWNLWTINLRWIWNWAYK